MKRSDQTEQLVFSWEQEAENSVYIRCGRCLMPTLTPTRYCSFCGARNIDDKLDKLNKYK